MRTLMVNPYSMAFSGTSVPLEEALVVVVGAPLEATVSYRPGTRFGPRAVREASAYIEFWSLHAQLDVEEYHVFHDIGDVLTGDRIENVLEYISEVFEYFVSKGKSVAMIGGEHTVTLGVVKAMKRADKPLLVVFDAHLDLREEYEGRKVSHATVNARAAELIGGERIVVVGARAFSRIELERAKKLGVRVYTPLDNPDRVLDDLVKLVHDSDWLHISLDMDVFDPAFAPGVSNPEPEGLTPTQVLRMVEKLAEKAKGVVTFDVVEVSPPYDCSGVTSVLAAKSIIEFTAGLIKSRVLSSGRGA